MPIKIANSLPARAVLESENIFVMTEYRALHQDIRPLRLAMLNLMPTKIVTETQILRCLSNTPLQIEVDLIQTSSYTSTHTPEDHLLTFYKTFDEIRGNKYDGFIITGAPVEKMAFEDVDYWAELCSIMDWTRTNVHSTLHICWGAQAALYHHYGIPKYLLPEKISGVFGHRVLKPRENLFRGFDDVFRAPHSRHTETRADDVRANPELTVLAESDEAGLYIAEARQGRQIFVMGHSEYDADTLKSEYFRDLGKGMDPHIPSHYFTDDDPMKPPVVSWRSHGQLLYTNWLNHYVYQTTPYDLARM
ncbi:homoserine O-acetyltransferase MetA [Intestinibacillus massiliensis]|uniref:homoserine O-acetyltransferase MetA n=1 Tax=Intestinibacillus massiliensis TaxID=1871029 RepID=UPI000B3502A6|nr:homoserine O-succinyltransferase [Intestinibacillus massiliensis]